MDYVLKVMSVEDDYKGVRRIIVVRPAGYVFDPGKGVLIAVNKPGMEDIKRRAAFFSLNNEYYIELVFNEDTADPDNMPFYELKAGEELIVSDIIGNIKYTGAGAFIAAGKGIFPFLDVFKHLKKFDALEGNTLMYFARTQDEVMYDRMLKHTFPNNCVMVLGRDANNSIEVKKIDETLLKQKLPNLQQEFYVAGPRYFVENTVRVLEGLGVKPQFDVID